MMSSDPTNNINALRMLCCDMVQKANSGHPGAPMGMAPVAYKLFTEFLSFDPTQPQWHNRDRFVLSNGHASSLIYSLLHLAGYPEMTMDQLKQFRQLGALTAGHPECHLTAGVEVTTGPLGQGIANSVGLAMAEEHLAAIFNKPGFPVCDHHTFVFCGDGCLMEGIAQEALSLAGHMKLSKLIIVYDDNDITIDGHVNCTYTEDKEKKYQALGFNTIVVKDGDTDFASIEQALRAAKANKTGPTMILLRTTIGYLAKKQGTAGVHGSPLGAEEIKRIKTLVGRDPTKTFHVEDEVYQVFGAAAQKGKNARRVWGNMMVEYAKKFPELAAQYKSYFDFTVPAELGRQLPLNTNKGVATRQASEKVLANILPKIPCLVGGSADLTGSNLTNPKSANLVDFQPGRFEGRYFRYGVREHAMVAIMNGMDAHGGLVPYAGTFLNFAGYALGALRLSAMSRHGIIFVATHDSIGLGEDGPTHQPVEIVPALRATPNMLVLRPADQTETSAAWLIALEHRDTPSILCLSRQAAPPLSGTTIGGVRLGAYAVAELPAPTKKPAVVLIGTGTEVSLALEAGRKLIDSGVESVRVVSMPSWELFEDQSPSYRRSLFPAGSVIVSIEPFASLGWDKYSHTHIGLKDWGASAPAKHLYKSLGITSDAMVAAAKGLLDRFGAGNAPAVMNLVAKM